MSEKSSNSAESSSQYILPRVDVVEDSHGITLLADLPGVKRDKLELKD